MNTIILTNQPETVTIPSVLFLRAVGCWRVLVEVVFGVYRLAKTEVERLVFLELENKMDKTDDSALTNQPETRTIPPPSSSQVMECWGVVVEAVVLDV